MADIMAKTIKFPGLNNTYEFMQPDGSYPDLTAGNIISNDAYTEDTEPYLFRALPFKSKRLEEDLVGATVNWNQLVRNGKFASDSNWSASNATYTINNGICTFTANSTNGNISTSNPSRVFPSAVNNHKYLASARIKLSTATTDVKVRLNGGYKQVPTNSTTNWQTLSTIYNLANSDNGMVQIIDARTSGFDAIQVDNVMVVDLTQFFGNSTIADAIYAMEQATAGSGVEFMRKYFSKLFDAEYDDGTLKSVNPTAHVTRGVNAWDEEWELGALSATGGNATSSTEIRSKNYIPVVGGQTYFLYCAVASIFNYRFYDADKNFISGSYISRNNTLTIPNDARYMRFYMGAAYGTTYKNDICINISDSEVNGKYFPYEEHTYPLGDVTLRGIPKLVNNELVYDGDIYSHDGAVTRKYGVVDLGPLTWTYNSSNGVFASETKSSLGVKVNLKNAICGGNYIFNGDANATSIATMAQTLNNKEICCYSNADNANRFILKDSAYTNANTLKTALSGTMLVYEKATDTTETTTPFEQYQICTTGGTEEYTTTNDVPVGHDTKYYTDLAQKIADLPFDMSMIAPVEETYTATRNYAVGDYLIVDNTFYKVTSAIANGGAITPNTNVTATTVATELIALR